MIKGIILGSTIISILSMSSALLGQGKSKYPFPILSGQTIQVPCKFDTLWVFKHSQYKRAIKSAKNYEIDSLKINLLEQRFDLQRQVLSEKDSVISAYKNGYQRYLKLWEETSFQLEEAEVKASQRLGYLQAGVIIGAIVTAAIGASIVKWD